MHIIYSYSHLDLPICFKGQGAITVLEGYKVSGGPKSLRHSVYATKLYSFFCFCFFVAQTGCMSKCAVACKSQTPHNDK